MILAITGSRNGGTHKQLEAAVAALARATTILHGGCRGVDHQLACRLPDRALECYPGPHGLDRRMAIRVPGRYRPEQREITIVWPPQVIHPPMDYLDRDRLIVDLSVGLVACPDGPERQRSGTWATIRHARATGKPIMICWPDGTQEREP